MNERTKLLAWSLKCSKPVASGVLRVGQGWFLRKGAILSVNEELGKFGTQVRAERWEG